MVAAAIRASEARAVPGREFCGTLWWLWLRRSGGSGGAHGGTRPGGQPANQIAFLRRANYLLILVWALAAEGVDINSLDVGRDVLAARSRLRDTLTHKKRPCHAELVAEGKKRHARAYLNNSARARAVFGKGTDIGTQLARLTASIVVGAGLTYAQRVAI